MVENKNISTLEETIDLMMSNDYKDRLLAEYYQLKIRIDKLSKLFNSEHSNDVLPEKLELLRLQRDSMIFYKSTLELRLKIDGVIL